MKEMLEHNSLDSMEGVPEQKESVPEKDVLEPERVQSKSDFEVVASEAVVSDKREEARKLSEVRRELGISQPIEVSQDINPTKDENAAPRDMETLSVRLREYFHQQDDPLLQKFKENYLKNVNGNGIAMRLVEAYPDHFDLLFYILGKKVLDSEEIAILAHNVRERNEEISRNEADKHRRILINPYATEEEYRLGIYKESLESQVRDAVFILQQKGYLPVESGFDDLVIGSQYIGIEKRMGMSEQYILDSIVHTSNEEASRLFGLKLRRLSVDDSHPDLIKIVLVPENETMSLEEWKTIWIYVAQCLPQIEGYKNEEFSDNGSQGVEFRKAQDKMRKTKIHGNN